MAKNEQPETTTAPAPVQINAKTIGIVGVSAAAGALALMATRKVTKLSPKNARMLGALGGVAFGYVGAQRMAADKNFLPFGN